VTLVLRGYVEKDPHSDLYQLTYRLFAVGSRAAEQLGLREVAQPIMYRLASRTGETVNLGVLDGFRTVSIYLVERHIPFASTCESVECPLTRLRRVRSFSPRSRRRNLLVD